MNSEVLDDRSAVQDLISPCIEFLHARGPTTQPTQLQTTNAPPQASIGNTNHTSTESSPVTVATVPSTTHRTSSGRQLYSGAFPYASSTSLLADAPTLHGLSNHSKIGPVGMSTEINACTTVDDVAIVPVPSPSAAALSSPLSTFSCSGKPRRRVFFQNAAPPSASAVVLVGAPETSSREMLHSRPLLTTEIAHNDANAEIQSQTYDDVSTHEQYGTQDSNYPNPPKPLPSMATALPYTFGADVATGALPLPLLPQPMLLEEKDALAGPGDDEPLITSGHPWIPTPAPGSVAFASDVLPSGGDTSQQPCFTLTESKQLEGSVAPTSDMNQFRPQLWTKRIRREPHEEALTSYQGGMYEFDDNQSGESHILRGGDQIVKTNCGNFASDHSASRLFEAPLRSPNAPRKIAFQHDLWGLQADRGEGQHTTTPEEGLHHTSHSLATDEYGLNTRQDNASSDPKEPHSDFRGDTNDGDERFQSAVNDADCPLFSRSALPSSRSFRGQGTNLQQLTSQETANTNQYPGTTETYRNSSIMWQNHIPQDSTGHFRDFRQGRHMMSSHNYQQLGPIGFDETKEVNEDPSGYNRDTDAETPQRFNGASKAASWESLDADASQTQASYTRYSIMHSDAACLGSSDWNPTPWQRQGGCQSMPLIPPPQPPNNSFTDTMQLDTQRTYSSHPMSSVSFGGYHDGISDPSRQSFIPHALLASNGHDICDPRECDPNLHGMMAYAQSRDERLCKSLPYHVDQTESSDYTSLNSQYPYTNSLVGGIAGANRHNPAVESPPLGCRSDMMALGTAPSHMGQGRPEIVDASGNALGYPLTASAPIGMPIGPGSSYPEPTPLGLGVPGTLPNTAGYPPSARRRGFRRVSVAPTPGYNSSMPDSDMNTFTSAQLEKAAVAAAAAAAAVAEDAEATEGDDYKEGMPPGEFDGYDNYDDEDEGCDQGYDDYEGEETGGGSITGGSSVNGSLGTGYTPRTRQAAFLESGTPQDLRSGRQESRSSERLRNTIAAAAQSVTSQTSSHVIVDGDEYLCFTCSRRFKKLAALRRHERIHVQGRPYACSWPHCSRRFSERANLKRHIKIHLGQRDFVCKIPGCSQKFGRKSHLVHHLSGAKHAKVSLEWYLDENTLRAVEECRLRRTIKPRRRSIPGPGTSQESEEEDPRTNHRMQQSQPPQGIAGQHSQAHQHNVHVGARGASLRHQMPPNSGLVGTYDPSMTGYPTTSTAAPPNTHRRR